ncbi:MAG: hypothetical protein QOE70_3424 [Chthoniobacter sp.]|jgi:hypothetical protein|nr:hypothetical protein [Chthoniobacter sp.]
MLSFRVAFLVLGLCSSMAVAEEDPHRYVAAGGVPRYDRWVREYFGGRFHFFEDDALFRKTKHKYSGMAVVAELRMGQVTGEAAYAQRGRALFGMLLEFAPGNPEVLDDCFGFYPLLLAGKLLQRAGEFDPAWEKRFHACVVGGMEKLRQHPPMGDGNQDLARDCAIACALQLYPEEFANFRAPLEAFWQRVIRNGDLWLDSKTYTPVSVEYLLALADELGRVDEIRHSEGLHRMFGNFRDVMSPNGFMPEFGHAYFEPPGQPDWLYVFEWAAALYDDPTFLYAARKFFAGLARYGEPKPASANQAFLDCNYCLAGLLPSDRTELLTVRLPKCTAPPVAPALVSGITRRMVEGQGERDGFLILRSGLEPGAPMLLMDLLSFGDHALFEQRPSLGYYETGHVPQFYQYGRYAQAASRGNVVLLKPAAEEFPENVWKENTWRTVSVPLERFDGVGRLRTIDKISLRTFGDAGKKYGQTLYLDNVRLLGPAGEKKLFDFEDGLDWTGQDLSLVDDATSGRHGLKIPIVKNGVSGKPLGLSVRLDDYTTMAFDAKWTGQAMPLVQVRPGENNACWAQLQDMTLLSHVRRAETAMRGRDAFARIEFDAYATYDTTLVRQVILTEEGAVFVRDDLVPGRTADGLTAGSLWQMYSVDAHGPQWFSTRGEGAFHSADLSDAKEYTGGMLAWFDARPGQTVGLQEIPNGKGNGPTYRALQRDTTWRIAYARETLKAGVATWFDLVVLPHASDLPPEVLAAGISVLGSAERTVFQAKAYAELLQATIEQNGAWKVERRAAQ